MKTNNILMTLMAITLLVFNGTAEGGESETSQNAVDTDITDQIRSSLNYPDARLSIMGEKEVIIDFYVNNDFELILNEIKSSNGFLIQEVRKMLSGKKVYTQTDRINKNYQLKLKFVQ